MAKHLNFTQSIGKMGFATWPEKCEKKRFQHSFKCLSKQFPNAFTLSLAVFRSYLTQHGVHIINYGPIQSEIANKARYDF